MLRVTDSPRNWHSMSMESVIRSLVTDGLVGLRSEDASSRLVRFGENRLPERRQVSPLIILANQLANIMIALLFLAVVFSLATGQELDAIAIVAVMAANTALGFIMEYRAEKASQALKSLFITSVVRTFFSWPSRTTLQDVMNKLFSAGGNASRNHDIPGHRSEAHVIKERPTSPSSLICQLLI